MVSIVVFSCSLITRSTSTNHRSGVDAPATIPIISSDGNLSSKSLSICSMFSVKNTVFYAEFIQFTCVLARFRTQHKHAAALLCNPHSFALTRSCGIAYGVVYARSPQRFSSMSRICRNVSSGSVVCASSAAYCATEHPGVLFALQNDRAFPRPRRCDHFGCWGFRQ
jgi:hypothetical protein